MTSENALATLAKKKRNREHGSLISLFSDEAKETESRFELEFSQRWFGIRTSLIDLPPSSQVSYRFESIQDMYHFSVISMICGNVNFTVVRRSAALSMNIKKAMRESELRR